MSAEPSHMYVNTGFMTSLQYSFRFIVVVKVLIFQLLDALSDRQTLDCLTYLTRVACDLS